MVRSVGKTESPNRTISSHDPLVYVYAHENSCTYTQTSTCAQGHICTLPLQENQEYKSIGMRVSLVYRQMEGVALENDVKRKKKQRFQTSRMTFARGIHLYSKEMA